MRIKNQPIGGENDTLSFSVPLEWEGNHYPSYIPESYAVTAYDSGEAVYCEIEYSNHPNGMLRFIERVEEPGVSTGLEGAVVSLTSINDRPAMVCQA